MTQSQVNISNQIYGYAINAGVTPSVASYIVAQALHETGGFTSSLYQRANNLFGMNVATVRDNHQLGKDPSSNYANYGSLQDSVLDLLDWFNYEGIDYNSIGSLDDYNNELSTHDYYTASPSSYLAGLTNFYNNVISFLSNNSLLVVGILAVGILLVLAIS